MLATVTAVEFVRPVTNGRTSPLIVNCEKDDGSVVTVVAKFSGFCELKEVHLAREIIGACLAADLGLSVPEPFIVVVPQGWSDLIADVDRGQKVQASGPLAFGSTLVTGGYSAWTPDTQITEGMLDIALAVFAFDGIVQNSDRRVSNPNCLVKGEEIRIFDHEMAFAHRFLLGWRPPWQPGGLNWMETIGSHIFYRKLKRAAVDLSGFQLRMSTISDARIADYRRAIPAIWNNINTDIDSALTLIRDARDNIADCVTEIRRVLT